MTFRKYFSNVKPFLHLFITMFAILAIFVADDSDDDDDGDPQITTTVVSACDAPNTKTVKFRLDDLISEFSTGDLDGNNVNYDVRTLRESCAAFSAANNGDAPTVTDLLTSDTDDATKHYFEVTITSVCSRTEDSREVVRRTYTVDDMIDVTIDACNSDESGSLIRFSIANVEIGMADAMVEIRSVLEEPCNSDTQNLCDPVLFGGKTTLFTWMRDVSTSSFEGAFNRIGGTTTDPRWFPNTQSCCEL